MSVIDDVVGKVEDINNDIKINVGNIIGNITRKYSWKPDVPDINDFLYESIAPPLKALPPSIDLRATCSPVEDQGDLGSCTANALAGAMEFLEDENKVSPFNTLSRLFIYYNERVIEGTVRYDSGAQIRDGIKSLSNLGVCAESLWPYNVAAYKTKPTANCYADGLKRKIVSYYRINTLSDMKTCLASGFPFVFGFSVYTQFESQAAATTGIINLPVKGDKCLGGHAVLCVGYDDTTQRFLVRNSWGTSWGIQGYFTIPYTYLTNVNLADDMWTIRK